MDAKSITRITDLSAPELSPYCRLKKSVISLTYGSEYFIGETYKVVRSLLKSDFEIVSILLSEQWLDKLGPDLIARDFPAHRILCAPNEKLESIVGFSLHQGIMACARRPINRSIAELGCRIVALDGVVNPENVGSMVRSAAAFGFDSFLLDPRSADPYLRRSVRVSMGHVFPMKVRRGEILRNELIKLRAMGYQIIGTDVNSASIALDQIIISDKVVLVIGSEVNGMDPGLFDLCDHVVEISTAVPGFALNASHAASVMMYEIFKADKK